MSMAFKVNFQNLSDEFDQDLADFEALLNDETLVTDTFSQSEGATNKLQTTVPVGILIKGFHVSAEFGDLPSVKAMFHLVGTRPTVVKLKSSDARILAEMVSAAAEKRSQRFSGGFNPSGFASKINVHQMQHGNVHVANDWGPAVAKLRRVHALEMSQDLRTAANEIDAVVSKS